MVTRMPALVSWPGLLLLVAVTFGFTQLVGRARAPGPAADVPEADCAAWDRAASAGIATLISDTSAAAELRLDEAIAQLRRARKHCRSGATALAGHDYASLHQSFSATGSTRANDPDNAAHRRAAPPRP
jgi:hypothetical protein